MNKEIEIKFLLDNSPVGLVRTKAFIDTNKVLSKHRILQTYLFVDDELELRIRSKRNLDTDEIKYYLTIKTGDGLVRGEIEKEIDCKKFEDLYYASRSNSILKERYSVLHKGLIYEIDIYDEMLNHLNIAEVELKSEEEVIEFMKNKPDFLKHDVTDDKTYKNKNLWKSINEIK